ncbi:MAG: hypothetical protein HQ572_02620, partial [Candidatus Omnitrophica bacterium]|nr:hypothetical protein [Candidatus Omnitrophota bacterium]
MREKRERIGEILIRNKYINKDMLDEALAYQRMSGCNITDYLLTHGYLNENDLAKCIAEQFRTPYLSLKSYKIPSDIIQTIPVETAEKYWLIPIEKIENSIILVMVNPLNARAIEEVEKI